MTHYGLGGFEIEFRATSDTDVCITSHYTWVGGSCYTLGYNHFVTKDGGLTWHIGQMHYGKLPEPDQHGHQYGSVYGPVADDKVQVRLKTDDYKDVFTTPKRAAKVVAQAREALLAWLVLNPNHLEEAAADRYSSAMTKMIRERDALALALAEKEQEIAEYTRLELRRLASRS